MQGELFIEPESKKRFDRLFFMVPPDIAAAIDIEEGVRGYLRDHRINAARQELSRQHISIQHVGDYPYLREKYLFAARRAASGLRMPAFKIILDAIGSFEGVPSATGRPRRYPLVMRASGDGLFELFDRLGAAAWRNGLPRNKHFVPHLTVSYGTMPVPFEMLEPIAFMARELVLIHSEVGLTRYHVLGRWPLRG
jgi:2'-5' RNA ligase